MCLLGISQHEVLVIGARGAITTPVEPINNTLCLCGYLDHYILDIFGCTKIFLSLNFHQLPFTSDG